MRRDSFNYAGPGNCYGRLLGACIRLMGTKTGEDGSNEPRAVLVDEFCNGELAVVGTATSLSGEVRTCKCVTNR